MGPVEMICTRFLGATLLFFPFRTAGIPTCDETNGETMACSEVEMILLQMDYSKAPKIRAAVQSFLEQLRSPTASTDLEWSTLRTFPPLKEQTDSHCANIGRKFPALVSRNKSVLDAYRQGTEVLRSYTKLIALGVDFLSCEELNTEHVRIRFLLNCLLCSSVTGPGTMLAMWLQIIL